MKWLENVKLAEITTMRLGGAAKHVAEVRTEEDVREAYRWAREHGKQVFIVGGGSNLIGADEPYDGLIILNRIVDGGTEDNGVFTVPSGVVMDDFIRDVVDAGWSGMEAMAKIPGTIGAAPVQNAGAYGQEIKDTLVGVRCYDSYTDEFVEIPTLELDFAYRHSIFNSGDEPFRYFIVSVTVKLHKGQMEPPFYNSLQAYLDEHNITDYTPRAIFDAVSAVRAVKLPDPAVEPSAGSFFKNIQVSDGEAAGLREKGVMVWDQSDGGRNVVSSGWLIENAGLKGREFNGFQVSDKAALILINRSAFSYADLVKARAAIVDAVREKYGIVMEQEPVEIR